MKNYCNSFITLAPEGIVHRHNTPVRLPPGNLYWRGRLCMNSLLVKIACLVKKFKIFSLLIAADLNYLVHGFWIFSQKRQEKFLWNSCAIIFRTFINTFLRMYGECSPNVWAGNTKGGSITVPLISCLNGLESAVWQLTI